MAEAIEEQDFLFDKSYTCPVCEKAFKSKTVRSGKARMLGTDQDLRPRFEGVDSLKYDAIVCPNCGYAALSRYFDFLVAIQKKNIQDKICANYKAQPKDEPYYTYDEAINRHKLALLSATVKGTKDSEKAYTCLKIAWLYRGASETTPAGEKYEEYLKQEENFLRSAFDGFQSARMTEEAPMCGMDEMTVDYLISALALHFKEYSTAMSLLSGIITSTSATSRMKDKARDLKEEVQKAQKAEE